MLQPNAVIGMIHPRILVVAHSSEPGAGSESGAGWVWPRMLARIADVWVVTRENHQAAIEASLPEVPERVTRAAEAAVAEGPRKVRPPMFEGASRRLTELVADGVIDGMSNERDGLASG
jgi:hypothetical protein